MFDTDQDGFLSWEEFQQVYKKLKKKQVGKTVNKKI